MEYCKLVVSSACILCILGYKTECRYIYVRMSGGGCLLTYIRYAVTQLLVIIREVYSLSFDITNCKIS